MTPSIPPLVKKNKIKWTNLTTARQDILSRFQLEHLTVYDQYNICADGIRKERQPETWAFSVSLRAFWLVNRPPLKLRRKVPHTSVLEEMVSNDPYDPFPH